MQSHHISEFWFGESFWATLMSTAVWPFASGWVLYVGWDVAFTLATFLFAVACAMLAGISCWGIAAVVTATQKVTKYEQQRVQETPCFLLHHFVSPGGGSPAWKHLRRPRSILLGVVAIAMVWPKNFSSPPGVATFWKALTYRTARSSPSGVTMLMQPAPEEANADEGAMPAAKRGGFVCPGDEEPSKRGKGRPQHGNPIGAQNLRIRLLISYLALKDGKFAPYSSLSSQNSSNRQSKPAEVPPLWPSCAALRAFRRVDAWGVI